MKKHLNSKRKIILLFAPFLVALAVVGFVFGIKFQNDERSNQVGNLVNSNIDYTYSKVYLADKDKTLVPLTIKYETFENQGEEMLYLISMLKKDSNISNENFNGLLAKDLKVNALTLNDNKLNVDFDDSFKVYDEKDELKVVESLVWTLLDLDYVNSLTISVNETLLTNMPLKNTPLVNPLTKDIGINNFELTSSIIQMGERVLSYYEKNINDKFYYVPVTHYVKNNNDLSVYDLTIQTLFKEPGITSSLSVCRCLKETSMVTSSVLKDNILYVSLTEDILFDELTVSYDVYKIIKEVTATLNEVKDVSFLMDLEEVMVNGLEDEEVKVSKIELNKFYI